MDLSKKLTPMTGVRVGSLVGIRQGREAADPAPYFYTLLQPLCQAVIFSPAVWLLMPGTVPRAQARLEWAAFTAMLTALSTAPTAYHLSILILAAALGSEAPILPRPLKMTN